MDFGKYGPWAFYVALVAALVLAFFPGQTWVTYVLAVLGLIVGLLNISKKETQPFLLAALAWMVAGGFLSAVFAFVPFLPEFLNNVVTFVGPAAAVVALVALYHISKD
ncbi:hypothetical protein KY320_02745 [Candidatus Woesearchaeota archaeon]|nr:hypothetical protein [Candidatus Woesearchaeota archaeon]